MIEKYQDYNNAVFEELIRHYQKSATLFLSLFL